MGYYAHHQSNKSIGFSSQLHILATAVGSTAVLTPITYEDEILCKYHALGVDDMNTHSVIVPNLSPPRPPESPRILPAWFTLFTTSKHWKKEEDPLAS